MKRKRTAQFGPFSLQLVLCSAAVCSMITGTLLAFFHPGAPAKASHPAAARLTFAERVAYQRAIEEVYWRHRIWPRNRGERPDPKPSLDSVMSQAQLENKVEAYLCKSQALEDYWQQPITAKQLQAEMDRTAKYTKQPDILRELFAALGNDSLVIAECLARPVLAERLITELNDRDRVKLTKVAWLTRTLQSRPVRAVTQAPSKVAAIDSTPKAFGVQLNRPYHLPTIAGPSGACTDDTWTPTSLTNAPAGREFPTAVWTGTEMIVWGGLNPGGQLNTGGRYVPSSDSWTTTSTANAPAAREEHTAIWTGTEMIVWGGVDCCSGYLNTGGRYNPATNTWTATSTINAPSGRFDHTAVWTGSEMIVWDGSSYLNTGGQYYPSADGWLPTSVINAPEGRLGSTAVWTGHEMIIWGGGNCCTSLNTGGRYGPGTNSWTATSTTGAPGARGLFTAVWTGSQMIVWGGWSGSNYLNTGGKYCAQTPPTPTPTATVTATATATVTASATATASTSVTTTPTVTATPRATPTPRTAPTPRPRPTPPPRP